MFLLQNEIKTYAWGSSDVIAKMQNRVLERALELDPEPEAELWMGAHPSASSRIEPSKQTLQAWIAEDPARALGAALATAFGGELPYLFKVLAAERPLSLQAHPSKQQAEAGFTRENTRGIPLSDKTRIYKDRNHKPELVCALEPFEALYGFRDPFESAVLFKYMGSLGSKHQAALGYAIASLDRGSPSDAMRCFLEMPPALRASCARTAADVCSRLPASEFQLVTELEAEYPGDIGALISLMMNHVRLAPGEALYLPAGNLHAYLHGAAVELMANSDNVLRGGLTPKHIDVQELLTILDGRAITPRPLVPVPMGGGAFRYDLGSRGPREFELWKLDVAADVPVELPPGPFIVLAVTGNCTVFLAEQANQPADVGLATLELVQGTSCFVSAAETARTTAHVRNSGEIPAVVYCATVPARAIAASPS